jgi:hypothetical protein
MKCSDKLRATELVFVSPAFNDEYDQLSAPYYPDWLDEDEEAEDGDAKIIEFKFGPLEEKNDNALLYLDAPGAGLSVRDGRLIVKTLDAETSYVPHNHRFHGIIFATRGFVTTDALAWIAREHVALLIVHEGECLALASALGGRLARRGLAAKSKWSVCLIRDAALSRHAT